jgi:hypothetical protein
MRPPVDYYQMSFYETAVLYTSIALGVYGAAWIVARLLGRGRPA